MNVNQKLLSPDHALTLTATQCAQRTGLTDKALRVYEVQGLPSPKRTTKDWRIYDAADLARIGEVSALRALGLKLADIRKLLKGRSGEIGRMLELQQEDLVTRRSQIDGALALVGDLRRRVAMGETLTTSDITTAIKESQMTMHTAEAISWKKYDQMRPRTAMKTDAQNMKDCAGYFLLDQSVILHVFEQDGKFMAQIKGQPALQIFPEAQDNYFYTAVPVQLVFGRVGAGRVNTVVLHQHGVETLADRISDERAEQLGATFKERVKSGKPLDNSAAVLEAIIRGQLAGKPRFDLMGDALAAAVREQNEAVSNDLAELGELSSLTFLAVTPEGWDVFRAKFKNGDLDCRVCMGADAKADGALLEAPRTESFWASVMNKLK